MKRVSLAIMLLVPCGVGAWAKPQGNAASPQLETARKAKSSSGRTSTKAKIPTRVATPASASLVSTSSSSAVGQPTVSVPTPPKRLLADGTPVKLEIQEQLKGNKVELGQEVHYLVNEEVRDGTGRVLIAKGAPAVGTVLNCKKAKSFGKSSELTFSADWVQATDGSRIPLNFRFVKQARNKGLIRFNSFFNPFSKGGDAKVKKGTLFTALVGQASPDSDGASAASAPNSPKPSASTTARR